MSIELHHVRLPLAHFTLEVNAVLNCRVTAIFGASGAGKTSLLEIIAGLRRPAAGMVRLDGLTLSDQASGLFVPAERRHVGYVPQDGALFPHLSVKRNLLYGFDVRRTAMDGLTFDHITDVLEIGPLMDRSVATLSGGEKQRVALGRALLSAPRLLLLDEPLSGLDAPLKDRLMPYLQRVRDEFTLPMLYITHSAEEVMALCEDVVVLAAGHVESRGAPAGLFVPSSTPHYVLKRG